MKLERNTYEVFQILSISFVDKILLKDLFDKTKFQYDKDRFGFNEPIYLGNNLSLIFMGQF